MTFVFTYSGQDDENLRRHDSAKVAVVRRLTSKEVDEEEVGAMYRVRFPEGCEHDVFVDELDSDPDLPPVKG